MADLPYPYTRIRVSGPDETGYEMFIHIGLDANGPVEGTTPESVLENLRTYLLGDSGQVSVMLTRYEIATTSL
ncbi:hypothetical protein ABZ753_30885 [Streptomyces griseoincarnatus]